MVCYTLAWLYVMGWPLRKTVLMSETCYRSQDCGLKYGERMQYKVALNGVCVCACAHACVQLGWEACFRESIFSPGARRQVLYR